MSNQLLIDSAVINPLANRKLAWGNRLFARWFNQLVYAQIWEDPRADLVALRLQPGERMVTISSGGCNALAYLAACPGVVHAVDLNRAHLATLEIKRAAFRGLPTYGDLLDFLGGKSAPENICHYENWVEPVLETQAKEWWGARDLFGRPRYEMFARNLYRHGLLGRFIGFSHLLVRLLGGNLSRLGAAETEEERQILFDRYLAPVFQNPIVRFLANRPTALYSLGIPPAQFEAIRREAPRGIAAEFSDRMRRLTCSWPLETNCFAMQAVHRSYDLSQQSSLPMYLQKQYYSGIRERLDNLHLHHASLTQFLRNQPSGSLDAYVILDAQDWMNQNQLNELWEEITRTACCGARVVFRSGGKASPLEGRLSARLLRHWQTKPAGNQAPQRMDRSAT